MFARKHDAANTWTDLLIYLAAFFAGWTLLVALVWAPGRPHLTIAIGVKALWWLGSAALYVVWLRRNGVIDETPARVLGLTAPARRASLIALAVLVLLFTKDYLRLAFISGRAPNWPDLFATLQRLDAPLTEEIVFSGLLLARLRLNLSPVKAVIATSLLFLAIHFPGWLILQIPVDALRIVTVFLVGVLCEVLRLWTRNLWPSIAVHWANNIGAQL